MEDVKFHRKPCDDYERNTRERRMKVLEIEEEEKQRERKREREKKREGRKRRTEREKGKAAMRASRSEFASSKPRGLPYIKVLFDSPFPFYANP